jgi:hypothetical protein
MGPPPFRTPIDVEQVQETSDPNFLRSGFTPGVVATTPLRQAVCRREGEVDMALLWALVLLLVIFAIVGGAAFSYWLFLLLVVALILALAGAF